MINDFISFQACGMLDAGTFFNSYCCPKDGAATYRNVATSFKLNYVVTQLIDGSL
jgi:hypothetical protein